MNLELLDLKQLDAFSAVISTGSVTGAARLIGRSQPVVTRLIQDLEANLGFPLLHRNGPRISPTDRGIRFHAEVERVIAGLRHVRERALAIAEEAPPAFEIAATPALAAGLVPEALAGVPRALLPRHVHVKAVAAEAVVQSVLARAADLGVASLPIEHPGLDVHWIGAAPCVAVVAADGPLAGRGRLRLEDLADQRVVTLANPFRLRRRIDDAFARAGLSPPAIIDTNSALVAVSLARTGLGVTLVEPATAYGTPLEGVAIRPLAVEIPFLFGVVSAFARPLPPALEALSAALQAAASRTLPGFRLLDAVERQALAKAVETTVPTAELRPREVA